MNSKFKIFLDLEETVIDSWDSGMLVNSAQVRDFLDHFSAKTARVFSFAVWDRADQDTFDRLHRRPLEKALDVHFDLCPTVQDFMQTDTALTGVHWHGDVTEFITLRGKVGAFTNWCRFHHPDSDCLLVDDIVPNMDIMNHDTHSVIRFVNVSKLT
jgi:hypothetical protein